ncbi:MAG: hypothetical protein PCFJNLEI_00104 [Verrucomicrobiae bacterium]|nr:hypothetical protein [Verrucomicrobiae bacterium]
MKLVALGLVMMATAVTAEVTLHPVFSENAVLQQGVPLPVWGTAADGEKVTVKFAGQEATATAQAGRWQVELKPLTAGGPFALTVTGANSITLTNILVGEVWLCSGQSNMEWPLRGAATGKEDAAQANDPQLRLLTVPYRRKMEPQTTLEKATWHAATPRTVIDFSGLAYYFGRDLRAARQVPVGLIVAAVGGTTVEAWMPPVAYQTEPFLKPIFADYQKRLAEYPRLLAEFQRQQPELMAKHELAVAAAKEAGRPIPLKPVAPGDPTQNNLWPAGMYNGMIAPLLPFPIRGVIWYQGESCHDRDKYRQLFGTMIRYWRQAWPGGAFPFLYVQLAAYFHNGNLPFVQEAQFRTLADVTNTAMVVTTDCGDPHDIHPKQKEPVGARLALAARALAYGEKIEYSGPLYAGVKFDGPRAVISFTHLGGGLEARGGELKGFTIAGADKKFVPATATVDGDHVIVTSPAVAEPIAVRHGWSSVPDVNLYNRAGLPAAPFRTDGATN